MLLEYVSGVETLIIRGLYENESDAYKCVEDISTSHPKNFCIHYLIVTKILLDSEEKKI
jgi:hypothetical protein